MVEFFGLVGVSFRGGVKRKQVIFVVEGFAIIKNSGLGIVPMKDAFAKKRTAISEKGGKTGDKDGKGIKIILGGLRQLFVIFFVHLRVSGKPE